MKDKRLCVYCKNFDIDFVGTSDWSDVTPGDPPSIFCAKYNFYIPIRGYRMSRKEFRTTLETALLCDDFEELEQQEYK